MEPSCLALCPLASSLALHCDVAHSQLSRSDSGTTAKINNSRKPKTFCGNPDHRQLFHVSERPQVAAPSRDGANT
ncbi:hypothetical protein PF005_g33751 [Phytophthora fragariae]|uniref:Uncharacterized protein n=1 Tax=Phytophthora fragariae TaxID=53985 RepID=A0A6A3ZTS8_9STRA|nr:hypothetical protein PF003_g11711 [Phytophthora fragariae]KAE8916194.1 hypothetical protein PF009_g33480 [Phytophthora fragariae]KAE8950696.1 hypothetical protein PF011_g33168 [Phytophthora fragariae]KAE9037041.1 hypothetical protein PF010_g33345 [Phytophthora fragariae]KAE9051001.1 hypothetical protein PF007_g33106 [Phytophthora fragariae]